MKSRPLTPCANVIRTDQSSRKLPSSALELAMQLLQYDPERRPSAEECLNHPYFSEEPAPEPPLG